MAEFTPMMKQYFKIKENYKDAILFYRLGDFYEMFFDDARTASRELELVLTGRDCGQEERAPMCGIPFHAADGYIARLVSKGYKVAVCEQTEDPSAAKGIVTRDVIRVHTPGTVIESSMLDEGKNNYLACLFAGKEESGVCFADVSTGEIHAAMFSGKDAEGKIINEVARFMPTEVLVNDFVAQMGKLREYLTRRITVFAQTLSESDFDYNHCRSTVEAHFGKNLTELSLDDKNAAVSALGATLDYLTNVQKQNVVNLTEVDVYNNEKFMNLDAAARINLELCETQRRREKKGSLLWVLDRTKTPMGKRLIRAWIEQPLVSVTSVIARQNAVAELSEDTALREELIQLLANVNDIERILTRVVYGSANAKELRSLSQAVANIPAIKALLSSRQSKLLSEIYSQLDPLDDICKLIDDAICEDPPFSVREGDMIKKGFNQELDSLHEIVTDGKS